MNILNNLWLAVSTPNEFLVKICISLLIIFIETPLSFSLICNIFNIICNKKQKFIYIIVVSVIGIISMYILPSPYNTILNYSSAFLILYFVIKLGVIKSVIASIFPSIIFNLVVNLLFNPYLSILNITLEQALYIPIYRIPFVLLVYLIILLLNMAIKYKNISVTILDNIDKRNKFIITLNFLFAIIYIIIQGILTSNYINILPVQFTFFNFICLLIYFSLSFYSLAKIMKLVTTTQKLESAEEYNKTLHILHDSVRGFKHDFDNIVTTIGGYIKTNDMDGLKKYYS